MSIVPILPNTLAIATLFNSLNILRGTLIRSRVFPPQKVQSETALTFKKSARSFYLQDVKRLVEQDFCGALDNFNQALKINPNSASAYNDRGVTRYNVGDKHSAL